MFGMAVESLLVPIVDLQGDQDADYDQDDFSQRVFQIAKKAA